MSGPRVRRRLWVQYWGSGAGQRYVSPKMRTSPLLTGYKAAPGRRSAVGPPEVPGLADLAAGIRLHPVALIDDQGAAEHPVVRRPVGADRAVPRERQPAAVH